MRADGGFKRKIFRHVAGSVAIRRLSGNGGTFRTATHEPVVLREERRTERAGNHRRTPGVAPFGSGGWGGSGLEPDDEGLAASFKCGGIFRGFDFPGSGESLCTAEHD